MVELDRLPVGVVHVDGTGTIVAANRLVATMVGTDRSAMLGRSIFDFTADDPARSASMLDFGTGFTDGIMGPLPVTYRHVDGTVRRGDLWAENHLADPAVGAFVIAIIAEQSSSAIADAQSSVAEGAPVDTTLSILAASLRGNPFLAVGCWLVREGDSRRLAGTEAIAEPVRVALDMAGPWWGALRQSQLVEIGDVTGESDEYHRLLHAAGVAAWWLMPVPTSTTSAVDAAIIIVRSEIGPISPNQTEHLHQIVTTAGLAFERAAMQQRLSHAAFHDSLTGVGNRERFFDRAGQLVDEGTALLYVDLDEFKAVNDRHGHTMGDLVLVTVADRIRNAIRPSDRVTRMGGDEFVVECRDVAGPEEAVVVAERIIDSVSRPISFDSISVQIGASVGIACCTDAVSVDHLLETSDMALYDAKAAGRGRWHLAEPSRPAD